VSSHTEFVTSFVADGQGPGDRRSMIDGELLAAGLVLVRIVILVTNGA
jgi:hypothetical protein